jgi:hypothetical protein
VQYRANFWQYQSPIFRIRKEENGWMKSGQGGKNNFPCFLRSLTFPVLAFQPFFVYYIYVGMGSTVTFQNQKRVNVHAV